VKDRKLIVNEAEAESVRLIFRRYLALRCVSKLRAELDKGGGAPASSIMEEASEAP
jgi:site-specific DNA recombinase